MKIWIITIGEPVPLNKDFNDRLHRSGFFARFLASHGHKVIWWTSTFDHFRKKHMFDSDTMIELENNLKIYLLFGGGYKKNISFERLIDHIKIAKKFAMRALLEDDKPDILVCSLPTIELCFEASKFGSQFNIPVLLDMRDMWPDIFVDSAPRLLRPLVKFFLFPYFKISRDACAHATAITGVTESFVDWGIHRANRKRHELDRAFYLGYSVPEPDTRQLAFAEEFWNHNGILKSENSFNICFIGSIGRQFDFETIYSAAKCFQERNDLPIKFVLCGSGDKLEYYKKYFSKLSNVIFPGWINTFQIHSLMRRSAIGLNPLIDRYDFRSHINNKAIEYLSASLPIFTTITKGVLSDLLIKNNCGLCYSIGDHKTLVESILHLYNNKNLLENMKRNAHQLFVDMFDAKIVYTGMMEHLEKIIYFHNGEQKKYRAKL